MEELIQAKLRRIYNDNSIIFDKSHFIGGLTNYNYLMNINGTEYVIRKPGNMTHLMIDRENEKINNQIASEIGLNSKCIYFDEDSGIKISIYIKDSKNIGQSDPCSPANIKTVSSLMKKLHSSQEHFPNIFDWQKELNKYEQIVEKQKGLLFSDYNGLKEQLIDLMEENIEKTNAVPCHNDTVPENFVVDSKGKAYLIDWEYSGMNDPSWDLAAYILESNMNQEAIEHLFLDYYGKLPDFKEMLKIKLYIVAQDLLWMVWAMIRHYSGEDFLSYCYRRYERFKKNLKAIAESKDYPIADMVSKVSY